MYVDTTENRPQKGSKNTRSSQETRWTERGIGNLARPTKQPLRSRADTATIAEWASLLVMFAATMCHLRQAKYSRVSFLLCSPPLSTPSPIFTFFSCRQFRKRIRSTKQFKRADGGMEPIALAAHMFAAFQFTFTFPLRNMIKRQIWKWIKRDRASINQDTRDKSAMFCNLKRWAGCRFQWRANH